VRDFIGSSFAASAPSREGSALTLAQNTEAMTQTVSGIDGVKTVGRARGVKTVGCAGSSAASKAAPSGVPWTRWRGP